MALSGWIFCNAASRTPCIHISLRRPFLNPSPPSWSHHPRTLPFIVSASPKKFSSSSRTGKFDSKNRRTSPPTKEEEGTEEVKFAAEFAGDYEYDDDDDDDDDPDYFLPQLPGDEPDFWEGPQWEAFGFFIQYLWAFGVFFALIACAIAAATYNGGATDFKETAAYKESMQSQELLEGPDASNSDVFESNPTEQAPSLE